MQPADIYAVAALVTAVAALLHSAGVLRQLNKHKNAGHPRPLSPRGRFFRRTSDGTDHAVGCSDPACPGITPRTACAGKAPGA